MEQSDRTPGARFGRRIRAAALVTLILLLTALSVVNGVRAHRAIARLGEYEAAEEQRLAQERRRLAEEEAERIRNAVPPEKEKPALERDAAAILAENRVIAHAMGSVDGTFGLNCLEAFEANYAAGVRVFEADFRMTGDGRVVLRHDWRAKWQDGVSEISIPTLEEFRSLPILGRYTPLTFVDLLRLMERYPDICIVTDTKFLEPEAVSAQFREMLAEAHGLGLSYLFDRMAVQIYSPLHFSMVDSIHHFPHYIYTLYQDRFDATEEGFRNKAVFAGEHGIEAITMVDYLWNGDWRSIAEENGIRVYVHTVNDRSAAQELLLRGVSAVYSDTLLPADMEE